MSRASSQPFLPAHSIVTAEGESPRQGIMILHGIFGRGRNWRNIARQVVERRPHWAALLVDLRLHGASRQAPAPHTVANAANDLDRLISRLADQQLRIRVLAGHSFGAKVALYHSAHGLQRADQSLIMDISPSARPELLQEQGPEAGPWGVLQSLEKLPKRFDHRDDFVQQLEADGYSTGMARWLATNLERSPDGFRLGLPLESLRPLLNDHFRLDLWHIVEAPHGGALRFLLAGRSAALTAADRERLESAAKQQPGRLEITHLPEASHWVHSDAPEAVVDWLCHALD